MVPRKSERQLTIENAEYSQRRHLQTLHLRDLEITVIITRNPSQTITEQIRAEMMADATEFKDHLVTMALCIFCITYLLISGITAET